jgi:predicted protein tyrosine phosphatase
MIKITDKIYIGTVEDYREADDSFAFLCCAKHPVYIELGGTGAYIRKRNILALNMVDAPDPKYFELEQFVAAMKFVDEHDKVLVFCNQARSRSPVMAMLYLLRTGHFKANNLGSAYREMKKVYPRMQPNMGVIKFVGKYINEILSA